MAVPKRRVSKTRKRKRRTHWKTAAPQLVECPQCGETKKPHRICPECGEYKGKKVLDA